MIIRHDVPDAEYRIDRSAFPALAEMPFHGHGVLIADFWVVTAAHVTAAHAAFGHPVESVTINDQLRSVAEVVVHPGYKATPTELTAKALSSGDAGPLEAFAAEIDDIALIRLAEPVKDAEASPLYRGADEQGQIVEFMGRGATGTGLQGQVTNPLLRSDLRRAYQRVLSADERWLVFRFDAPPEEPPLAGQPSDGDSGGPILIVSDGLKRLAGLVSHKETTIDIDIANYHPCAYGSLSYQTRISRYLAWIDRVIGATTVEASS